MALYMFISMISFIIHAILIVPFIDYLYKIKFQRADQKTKDAFNKPTPIFDKFHQHKAGTPVGGGILIVGLCTVLYLFFIFLFDFFKMDLRSNYPAVFSEIKIIIFTFVSFALLGVYDDMKKIFGIKKKNSFFGLRVRHKLFLETVLALIISWWLYSELNISIINIPFFGVFELSYWYMLFSSFVIVAFANAVNITDGLDGLAAGVLMISITCFWVIARAIIDVPTSLFIAVWMGGLIAFLYFNIYPARLWMGDTGALSFGATYAVIGLILGKPFSLAIIGGVFVLEIGSSLLQMLSKRVRGKKLLPVAPLHLWLQLKGWPEPKIVMRLWLISILFSVAGLMIAFMR